MVHTYFWITLAQAYGFTWDDLHGCVGFHCACGATKLRKVTS